MGRFAAVAETLPAASRRVLDRARQLGIEIEIDRFPQGTRTAADAAAAIGCEVGAIVKSLVFMVDERPVVALVPGDRRLDPVALAAAMSGSHARRASLEEARAATGYAVGGTPPFGYPGPVPVLADPGLREHEQVWAAGGTPDTVFPIDPIVLAEAAGAVWAPVI
jgi:prolyl-tRNA editing enzyme YbaK/EbsC (Cys-tRNA(Pro) deacylase)